MFILRFSTLLLLLRMVTSCEQPTADLSGLHPAELRKEWRACAYIVNPSNREKQMCDHYEHECQRRKNLGSLACY